MDRPRRSQRVVINDTPAESPRDSIQPPDQGRGSSQHTEPRPARPHRYRPYGVVPTSAPTHYVGQQWPLSQSSKPLAPGQPIAPGQARHSTFASRLRMGVSTLMQPLPPTGDFSDPVYGRGGHSELAPLPGATRSGRATRTAKYYEDESPIEEDSDSDEEDTRGTGGRNSPRKGGSSQLPGSSSRGTPVHQQMQQAPVPEPPEVPGHRLGKPPPANKVFIRKARRTPHVYHSQQDMAKAAESREVLIPIKIELETDTHRIRDSFVWNVNEKLMTPRQYIKVFLQDLDLPWDPYGHQMEASIQQQIDDWQTLAEIDVSPAKGGVWSPRKRKAIGGLAGEGRNEIEEPRKDARGWDWGIQREFKRFIKTAAPQIPKARREKALKRLLLEDDGRVEGQDGEWEDDLRVILDYEVQILHHSLRDRLEWDLSSPLTPEAFAAQTCKDIGLSGEAQSLISTTLRESLLNHKRAVGEMGIIGLGEMWGKAQADEDEARRDLSEEKRRKKSLSASKIAGTGTSTPQPGSGLFLSVPSASNGPSTAMTSQASTPAIEYAHDDSLVPESRDEASRTPLAAGEEEEAGIAAAADSSVVPAATRLEWALSTKSELSNRGPRPLVSVYRDWFESKNFGPLFEYLTDAEIERREVEALRAARRQRRDTARGGGGGMGGGGGVGGGGGGSSSRR